MNSAGPTSSRAAIRAQAAAWIARLQSDARTSADEAAFRVWLAENDAHRAAFDDLTLAWETAGGLAADYVPPAPKSGLRAPLRALVAASLAVVVMGAGLAAWSVVNAAPRYSTAVGETRRLSFADGSVVILDSDSELRARLRPARRDFRLARGRAHFEVAKDPNRPFVVAAGDRQVFALGTVFDVARSPRVTSVVLIEGRVAVQSTDLLNGGGTPRLMSPGERLTLSDDGSTHEDRPNLAKLTAWQSSQAVFDNDTMEAAVAELNRYSRRPIVITDPAVARMRVSGVFRAGATQDFAVSVSALLPIRVRAEPERILIEARSPAS